MCIFCKIINGEIPCYKIYEDDNCMAFLDLSQSNIGHTLVVPKKHFDDILSLDSDIASHLFKITTLITKKISKELGVLNFNILNNCGVIAGQTINHFHIHIIPRFENDNISINLSSNNLSNEELMNLANRLSI